MSESKLMALYGSSGGILRMVGDSVNSRKLVNSHHLLLYSRGRQSLYLGLHSYPDNCRDTNSAPVCLVDWLDTAVLHTLMDNSLVGN